MDLVTIYGVYPAEREISSKHPYAAIDHPSELATDSSVGESRMAWSAE
jgi:hypothetical protein